MEGVGCSEVDELLLFVCVDVETLLDELVEEEIETEVVVGRVEVDKVVEGVFVGGVKVGAIVKLSLGSTCK